MPDWGPWYDDRLPIVGDYIQAEGFCSETQQREAREGFVSGISRQYVDLIGDDLPNVDVDRWRKRILPEYQPQMSRRRRENLQQNIDYVIAAYEASKRARAQSQDDHQWFKRDLGL